jgi:light-regulated signal transduction histidine kinase (bacteriophytochrome)
MYGLPAQAAIGMDIGTLLRYSPDTAKKLEAEIDRVFASGQPADPEEWLIPLPDGREIWVLSTLFPVLSEGAVVEVFFMDVDITELKRATEEVRQFNVELEARVASRTAELAALNKELEAFSYSVSHDLRAPLRSIEGFGRLLEQDCAAQLDDAGKDYVQRMCRAAQRLASLIDDLLDLTRINRAEIRPEDVDLSVLAREIAEELRQGAPQRRVAVSIEDGLRARGDPRLLRIALQNLLDNAWKYSSKIENARVDFGCDMATGQPVYFVRDNGAGFDMAYAGKLFKPFQRLHDPREFEGTGIGLSIVHRIVTRHEGRIWAKAGKGEGATFFFTLG